MLKLAAAAPIKVWAEGFNAVGRGRNNLDAAVGLVDSFTRQGFWYNDKPAINMGQAIAALAKFLDHKFHCCPG